MKTYELTYIVSSGITSSDAEALVKDVESFIQGKEGVVLKSQKTAPQALAYPIKRNSSGYFITLEFQGQEGTIREVKTMLDREQKVLRSAVVVKKPVKQMKKRRTKPIMAEVKAVAAALGGFVEKKVKEAKVEIADIEKKLDEMLSE